MSETDEERVPAAVEEAVRPTVPEAPGVPVDLPAVAPPARDAPRWLPWLGVVGVLGLGVIAVVSRTEGGTAWSIDHTLHAWALAHRGAADGDVARVVTWAGATTITLPGLALLGIALPRGLRRLRDRVGAGMLLAGTASLGVALGLAVNHWVGRQRPPSADWWAAAGGPAFPSGHTTAATIAAATCAWALMSRVRSRSGKVAVWVTASAVALLVGWSRVWLGVHWPSDVLAGWLLGASWVAVVVSLVGLAERRWHALTGERSSGTV